MDHADTRLESGAQLLCDKVWSAHGELHVKTSYTKKFPDSIPAGIYYTDTNFDDLFAYWSWSAKHK
jgi:hypothetical protein